MFEPGSKLAVFDAFGVKVGLMICADMRYPELARELAVEHQVDLVLHPCAFSRDASFHSWHQFVIARALENQIYWLSLNYSGENFGASIFAPPWIDSTMSVSVAAQAQWRAG